MPCRYCERISAEDLRRYREDDKYAIARLLFPPMELGHYPYMGPPRLGRRDDPSMIGTSPRVNMISPVDPPWTHLPTVNPRRLVPARRETDKTRPWGNRRFQSNEPQSTLPQPLSPVAGNTLSGIRRSPR